MKPNVKTKRIYDPPEASDGSRVLVDRIWPRGISKDEAKLDLWLKEAAPSTDLRKWFGHDPERWEEFRRRYHAELRDNDESLAALRKLIEDGSVTLLYGARDEAHNNAVALKEFLGSKAD